MFVAQHTVADRRGRPHALRCRWISPGCGTAVAGVVQL